MKILVIGLGNPILGDDGVGWRVAERVQQQVRDPVIEVDFHAGGGLSLMERLIGYDAAILIDAINLGMGATGSVYQFALDEVPNPNAGHLASSHETNLQTALEVGRSMGAVVPSQIAVVAIESPNVYDFSEELTSPVAAAVPRAASLVIKLLQTFQEE
jgi:hydrogenase maturation protease